MFLFHIFDTVKYLVLNFNLGELRKTKQLQKLTNIITTKRLLLTIICRHATTTID